MEQHATSKHPLSNGHAPIPLAQGIQEEENSTQDNQDNIPRLSLGTTPKLPERGRPEHSIRRSNEIVRTSIDPDASTRTETKEPEEHTLTQDAPPAFLSLNAPSISNLGDELPLQFMFYEPQIQEPEHAVPKIWQDWGHVPRHEWARTLSTIPSRSREQSSSQRISSVSELPSIPADASASYLELITPKARPFAVLERFLGKGAQPKPESQPKFEARSKPEAQSRPEVQSKSELQPMPEVQPQPVPEPEISPRPESPSQSVGDYSPPKAAHKLSLNHETEHLNTHIADKTSSNDVTKTSGNPNQDQPSSPTNSDNGPQSLKAASVTAEDLIGMELPYHLLFAPDSTPPETGSPTSTKLPVLHPPPSPPFSLPPSLPPSSPPSPPQTAPQQLPPPAETRPLEVDDVFFSQPVPTKYLPVNEQLPEKMSWRDVLELAQSVLSEPMEELPVVRSKVNLLTVSSVDEDPDADRHSLLAKSHVAEVEQVVDDDEDDDTGSVVRSSFSSFDIRDVNMSLHKEMSRIWSWREKWRAKKRV
ncbi:hypothetical protein B0T20DRAFT_158992 [Sordaria brevicollis]|uniref:Uncharacterized protein n=1 Tax=Sordaria brevicollis TaxID=83679 RepID=A0AAE0UEM9_SORBR|nr:hypothetical protein B0T20DRAFT_158992 [Sordaria brevicollis]